MAIRAAREKASAVAEEVECKVGHPRTIQVPTGYWYWGAGTANVTLNSTNRGDLAAPGQNEDESDVMPIGQIEVRASVNAVFDLVAPEAQLESGRPVCD
jgi:hypothetical protein